MKQLKDAKTLLEQKEHIHNVHKLDITESTSQKILQTMNYYVIKGYGLEYIKNPKLENYKYDSKTKLDDIYDIFIFDNKLRSGLIWLIGIIEKNIRTVASICLSTHNNKQYGPECYLNTNIYLPQNSRSEIREFQKVINKILTWHNDPVIEHHKKTYNGRFPIWVIIEYIDLGKLKKFLKSLKQNHKNDIAHTLGIKQFFELDYYLALIKDLRNVCCHFRRIYNKRFTCNISTNFTPQYLKSDFTKTHKNGNKTQYFSLFSILKTSKQFLINVNCKNEWDTFYTHLVGIIDSKPKKVNIKKIGFKNNWKQELK